MIAIPESCSLSRKPLLMLSLSIWSAFWIRSFAYKGQVKTHEAGWDYGGGVTEQQILAIDVIQGV